MRTPVLTLLSLLLTTGLANAQQQAPTQHAPAVITYPDGSPEAREARKKTEDNASSVVTLSWYPIPRATRYVLMIARDSAMANTFFTVETVATAYVTPELPPGLYFYQVQGFDGERAVGKSTLQRFVIGKPVAISGNREKLPAPPIIAPKHLELFPTFGRVRLAWQAVDGARGYRFRIWNEDKVKENNRWKKDTPPRWITEVANPWIEVHDAPYTSFMYLESGRYRWDVAAVDKDGGYIGDPAMGYFDVSRQWFLKPTDIYLRLNYGVDPNARYFSNAAHTGGKHSFSGISHRFDSDMDIFFLRKLGLNFGGGLRTLKVPSETMLWTNFHLDMMFRHYLSHVPWGWTLILNLGLGYDEFPQVSNVGNVGQLQVDRPKAIGARLGFRLNKRFKAPWELGLHLNQHFHAFTMNSPGDGAITAAPLDLETSIRGKFHWTNHFALVAGLSGEYKRILYTPKPNIAKSSVVLPNWYLFWGVQFNYYADEKRDDEPTSPQMYERKNKNTQPWRP